MVIAEYQKTISANNLSMKFMVLLVDALLEIMFQKLINLTEESIQDVRNNTVVTMKWIKNSLFPFKLEWILLLVPNPNQDQDNLSKIMLELSNALMFMDFVSYKLETQDA